MPQIFLFFLSCSALCLITKAIGPINPAYTAPSSGKKYGGVVVPWSEYRQKLENEKKLLGMEQEEESNRPITIYLAPFHKNSQNSAKFSDNSGENLKLDKSNHQSLVPNLKIPSTRPESSGYSTNAFKEKIQKHENTFSALSRPQTHSAPNVNRGNFIQPAANSPNLPIKAVTNQENGAMMPQFTKLKPAPFNLIPANQGNLGNSVFEESQYRFSPQSAVAPPVGVHQPPPLSGSIFAPNPNAFSENMLNNLNPLQFLSTARDSPVEQIARIAKNLLSHENQQLFSSVANVLAGAKSNPLPPAISTSEVGENLLGSSAVEAVELVSSSSNKDEKDNNNNKTSAFTENEVIRSLNKLPEEQRKLLQEVINHGELDTKTLSGALLNTTNDKETKEKLIQSETKLIEWIQQNRPATTSNNNKTANIVSKQEKIPFYGRYCGSLVEQVNPTKNFGISGALWAVDNKRFIVSNFHYQPASISENVTFWSGPAKSTGNAVLDAFPSDNGVYLRPQPIEISIFTLKESPIVAAKIRHESIGKNEVLAEAEEEVVNKTKRDVFSNLYEERIPFKISANFGNNGITPEKTIVMKSDESKTDTANVEMNSNQANIDLSILTTITTSSTTVATTTVMVDQSKILPLEWYAGFQPLLLTLPENQYVKTAHWVSLYDHKKQSPIAFVLIPNGNAFQIPSSVQLRPFAATGAYKISSGPIHVLDTKTIEVSEFSLETGGVPVWFMVGKEVLPNGNGHIVPIVEKGTDKFDCMSLRDYHNETIVLRLPGALDIRDVFWFSVFSIPQAISMANIYLPYNDMHLPPDLDGRTTPICRFSNP